MGSSQSAASCRSPRRRTTGIVPASSIRRSDPRGRSSDEVVKAIIQRIWHEHDQAYGSRKVWKRMGRESLREARCRVRRLMRELGLVGVVRGRAWTTTTQPDAAAARPADLVDRHFVATRPTQLWVSDFVTWAGFVYVASVIDVFARRIVGCRVSSSLRADFVLDALEQAICARRDDTVGDLVHHSDRGSQYLSMRYTERLADAGIEPSVGSRGDSYDNALAEPVIGLFKAEVVRWKGPWRSLDGGRLCHAQVGALVQSSAAARSNRLRAPRPSTEAPYSEQAAVA